jgi:hypothetical protein
MQQELPISDRVRITETLIGDEFITRVQELERSGGLYFSVRCDKKNGVYEVRCDVPVKGAFIDEIVFA